MKCYHICYHTDEDGLASAAIIYEYLKRINKNSTEKIGYIFYKIDYTMDLTDVLTNIPMGDEIYFVDYSFSNKDNLKYVLEMSNRDIKVTWIDHHKTSYDIISDKESSLNTVVYSNFSYYINTNYCGAYLAYVYAYINLINMRKSYSMISFDNINDWPKYIPLYIKYVDSWDTWKHNMPNTIEFNTGIRAIERTPKNVISSIFKYNSVILNKLFSNKKNDIELIESSMNKYINDIISKGKVIKLYEDAINKSLCDEYGFQFNIIANTGTYYKCFAVNKRGNSTMFGDKINSYDIVVSFQYNGDRYIYSLYTNSDYINCEELAKKFGSIDGLGGGGHIQAAGFQSYDLLFKANHTTCIRKKMFSKDKYCVIITR